MTQNKKLSPEEIDQLMAQADGALGAAGHVVTDPQAREIARQSLTGELTEDEAVAQILKNNGFER